MIWNLKTRLLAAAAGAILLIGLGYGIYWKGREAGKQIGRAEQLEEDKKEWEIERRLYVTRLEEAAQRLEQGEKREQAALALLAQFQASLDRANERLASIQIQRESDRRTVTNLSDADVLPDLRARLGLVPPTDPSPLTSPELRRANTIVTDYPHVMAENVTLGEKVKSIEGKVGALDLQVQAVTSQRDAAIDQRETAIDYANRMEQLYAQAYNVAQKSRRRPLLLKIITLGIVRDRKLNLPDPVSIKSVPLSDSGKKQREEL